MVSKTPFIALVVMLVFAMLNHLSRVQPSVKTSTTEESAENECEFQPWMIESPAQITDEWIVERKRRLARLGFKPWDLRPADPTKTLYILFMGLEGSGHHKIQAELKSMQIPGVKVNAFTPFVHGWGTNGTSPTFTSPDDMEKIIRKTVWFNDASITVVIDGQNSCPSGARRLIQKCPDPLMWLEMERRGLLELKVVYLSRSFTDSVISALARRHTRDVDLQIRVEDISAAYLWTQLQQLPCDKAMVHPFTATLSQSGIFTFTSSPPAPPTHPYNLDLMDICKAEPLTGDACFQLVRDRIRDFAAVHRVKWPWLPV